MTSDEAALVSVKLSQDITVEFVKAYFTVYFSFYEPRSRTEFRILEIVIHGRKPSQSCRIEPGDYERLIKEKTRVPNQASSVKNTVDLYTKLYEFVCHNEQLFVND